MATPADVLSALREVAGTNAMGHLATRMAALTGGQEVVFADWSRKEEENLTSGTAVIFTESRVVVASAAQSAWDFTAGSESGPASVDVICWPRSSLTAISIDKAQEGNADAAWQHEWRGVWPGTSRVTLHYSGQDPLTLPLAASRSGTQNERWDDFPNLVNSLLDDLR